MRNGLLALMLVLLSVGDLHASPTGGQIVRGLGFEGVIFTPKQVHTDVTPFFPSGHEMWVPSKALILKAEAALPAGIAGITAKPMRPHMPKFYTTKNGTNLNLSSPSKNLTDFSSDTDFLYTLPPLAKYKRQYLGEVIKGKKVILLSFLYDPSSWGPPGLGDWKHHWIEVLDGGDAFWRVYYDPATDHFSDWQCNGEA